MSRIYKSLKPTDRVLLRPTVQRDQQPHEGPFQYDSWNMGTELTRGYTIMHPGFDSKESPQALDYFILHNNRTKQVIRVDLIPEKPEYREVIPMLDDDDLVTHEKTPSIAFYIPMESPLKKQAIHWLYVKTDIVPSAGAVGVDDAIPLYLHFRGVMVQLTTFMNEAAFKAALKEEVLELDNDNNWSDEQYQVHRLEVKVAAPFLTTE